MILDLKKQLILSLQNILINAETHAKKNIKPPIKKLKNNLKKIQNQDKTKKIQDYHVLIFLKMEEKKPLDYIGLKEETNQLFKFIVIKILMMEVGLYSSTINTDQESQFTLMKLFQLTHMKGFITCTLNKWVSLKLIVQKLDSSVTVIKFLKLNLCIFQLHLQISSNKLSQENKKPQNKLGVKMSGILNSQNMITLKILNSKKLLKKLLDKKIINKYLKYLWQKMEKKLQEDSIRVHSQMLKELGLLVGKMINISAVKNHHPLIK